MSASTSRAVVWALTASLALGGLAATLGSAAQGAEERPMAVTVPVGRIGDAPTFVYAYDWAEWSTAGKESGNASGAFGLTVLGTTRMMDRSGQLHDVLEVRRGESRQFIDLTTRDVIYRTAPVERFNPVLPVVDPLARHAPMVVETRAYGWTYYGPLCFSVDFEQQGRTFRLGEDYSAQYAAEAARCRAYDARIFGIPQFADATYRASQVVDQAGLVDGEPALRIRTELQLQSSPDFWHTWTLDRWVSSGSPYALFETYRWEYQMGDWRYLEEDQRYLTGINPGRQPIPWGDCEDAEHYTLGNPGLQRHQGPHRFPTGGDQASRFGLEQAWTQALGDPALVGFQQWRRANADAFLAGAIGRQTEAATSGEGFSWSLLAASRDGSAYRINASRMGPAYVLTDGGSLRASIPDDVDGRLPVRPVLLTEVEAVWRLVAGSDAKAAGANMIAWGRWRDLEPRATLRTTFDPFSTVAFGYQAPVRHGTTIQMQYDLIQFNLHTAELMSRSVGHGTFSINPNGTISDRPQFAPVTAVEVPRPPRLDLFAAVSGSALALFLLAYLYPLVKFGATHAALGLPGFARLRKETVLDHESRARVFELVRSDPGVSPPEVMARLDIPWSTLIYHLSVLERQKLISSLVDGRHKRFFPRDSIDWSHRGRLSALRNAKTRIAFDLIQEAPGIHQKEIAARLDVTPTAAAWHLQRLVATGLVGADRVGRKVRYYAASVAAPSSASQHGFEIA